MSHNAQSIVIVGLTLVGIAASAPVLFRGFVRRGTGVKYENNFMIQRAPQLMSFVNFLMIVVGFLAYDGIGPFPSLTPIMAMTTGEPTGVVSLISWIGVAIFISGLIFMIGGWYSLGECFTTDAEVLEGHTVRNNGLLRFVMHPAYSGIIQSLLGASLASTSIIGALFAIFVVGKLWLDRAKYEEQILLESLGESYRDYAESMKWRRLVPSFIPIGV